MLVIENCRLTWPDFTADYSLLVKAGHLCAVIGPSGGGKTTLLHMIAGFETPESGTLTFAGQNLLPLAPAKRPVAIVFGAQVLPSGRLSAMLNDRVQMGAALYQQPGAGDGSGGAPGPDGGAAGPSAGRPDDDVVDAEIVDEEKDRR